MIFFCLGVKVFLEELGLSEFYNWLISVVVLPILFIIHTTNVLLKDDAESSSVKQKKCKEVNE